MSIGPEYKKKYGLIIPKSREAAPVKKRPLSSVFNVDSDEEEEGVQGPLRPDQAKGSSFKNMKRQAKIDIQRALEDDPSVYQYDEIYDEMKEDKEKKLVQTKQDKTSKYAKNLIRNAAIRKLENDRHFERQCQKELEDEGDEFADKESFVTSSYKNKLAELAVLEEEHKRMAEEDKKNDVTKKRDLTDFYRNILSQRTEDIASSAAADSATTASSVDAEKDVHINEADTALPVVKDAENIASETIKKRNIEKKRAYRSRIASDKIEDQETGSEGSSGEESGAEDERVGEEERTDPDKRSEVIGEKEQTRIVVQDHDNPDRDDSNSSSSSEDENEDEDESNPADDTKDIGAESKATEPGESEMGQKKNLFLSEEEKREMRIKLVKESCKKRNTPESIQAAVERYWQRQAALTAS